MAQGDTGRYGQRAAARVEALERRIDAYERCAEDEHRALMALAMVSAPIHLTPLAQFVRALRLRWGNDALDSRRLETLSEKWRQGRLAYGDGSNLCCDPDLGAYLVRLAAETKAGDFLRAAPPWYYQRWSYDDAAAGTLFRGRMARVRRDTGMAIEGAAQWLRETDSEEPLDALFGPGDPWFVFENFATLFAPLSAALGLRLLRFTDVEWQCTFLGMLEDRADGARLAPLVLSRDAARLRKLTSFDVPVLMGYDEAYRHVWYTEQLFRGNDAELVARARTDEATGHLDALAFVGALELSRGHVDESIALFEKACGHPKKTLAPFHRRWVGSLRILALLARPSRARLEAAEKLLRQVIGKHSQAGDVEDPRAFTRLADYWATLSSGRVPELRLPIRLEDTPISALVGMLVTIWTAESGANRVTLRTSAETLQGEARAFGYRWLEREYGAVMLRFAAEAGALLGGEPGEGSKALVDLVGHRSAWMLTLEKLERVAESAAPRAEAAETPAAGASRIAWLVRVRGNTLFVEPRLQTEKPIPHRRGLGARAHPGSRRVARWATAQASPRRGTAGYDFRR